MCGIFGVINCSLPSGAIEQVLAVLKHRGPDGQGVYNDDAARVTLAHTRLAVIGLNNGAQPLTNSHGAVALVCNGEIYDFERTREELEFAGHRFLSGTNLEVILHLYEKYGLGSFQRLRGEFAFLLYDKLRRRLIAARDRF